MKKKWTWSQMLLTAAAVALLVSGSTFVAAKGGNGGGKPGGGKEDPQLPNVRYRIQFTQLPANVTTANQIPSANGFNNFGQVVGRYAAEDGMRMFLYDPRCDCDQAFDMNMVVDMNALETVGLDPSQWRLRSGLAINDFMVVVGNMEEISTGQVRPIAIDLLAENPVVDLLPDVGVDSHEIQINENGDILGIVELAGGGWASWIYNPDLNGNPELNGNPRLYGDPSLRPARDGTPLDMRDKSPDLLPLSGNAAYFELNNPAGEAPAQIAGVDADGVAFRYTLGGAEPKRFPELDVEGRVAGLNDSGTFCGLYGGLKGKNKTSPFRFNQSLELLPMDDREWVYGMNSSGDLITVFSYVYHNNWGWVTIDDLVVGTDADDVEAWRSGYMFMKSINDRGGSSDAGQIAGEIGDGRLFVLTPEPAP